MIDKKKGITPAEEIARLEKKVEAIEKSREFWRLRYSEQCALYHDAASERDQALKALRAHERFVQLLGEFMDLQSGLSREGSVDRYRELFQHILLLRERELEKTGFYPPKPPPTPAGPPPFKDLLMIVAATRNDLAHLARLAQDSKDETRIFDEDWGKTNERLAELLEAGGLDAIPDEPFLWTREKTPSEPKTKKPECCTCKKDLSDDSYVIGGTMPHLPKGFIQCRACARNAIAPPKP